MRKRPLCFFCIALVLIMWILKASGDHMVSPDVYNPTEKTVTVYGTVYGQDQSDKQQVLYLKQTVLSDFSQIYQLDNIKITYENKMPVYQVSDFVCVKGRLEKIKEGTNPGQFDARFYYQTKRVGYTMWNPEIELMRRPDFSFVRMLNRIRQTLAEQYDVLLPNQYGALLKGITLGDKRDISDEVAMLFQRGGISHILAISALHLQLLGNSVYIVLRRCRVNILCAASCAGFLLLSYGILTGANVATLRALIMFLLNIGADVTGRTYDGVTGMALAAVILVAGNPDYLSYSGFWLSFSAVGSFMLFKEKRKFASGVLLFFFMAPVMLVYFYEVSIYGTFLNLFVVPTIGIVLLFGMTGCAGSLLHPYVGKLLVFPAAALLHIYQKLCELNLLVPGNTLTAGKPTWMQVFLYYGILLCSLYWFRKNRLKKCRVFVMLLIIPAFMILTWRKIDGIQITMLDVGQGDCIVVQTETGNTYLIDGGSTTESNIGRYRILPYLKYLGKNHLDTVFLTHADEDHMNGIAELLDSMRQKEISLSIDQLVLPAWEDRTMFSELVKKASFCNVEVVLMEKGDLFCDGDMVLRCIHPEGGRNWEEGNEGSLVLKLEYKEFDMLFTGDLEGNAEKQLLGCYGTADLLKVAHHGSAYSTSKEFLKEVKPKICLISYGEQNQYGHPHSELIGRLEEIGAAVFETQKHGAITIRTDGEKIDLKTYKQYNNAQRE